MKKILSLGFIGAFIICSASIFNVQSFVSVPPSIRTGAPSEETCAGSGCNGTSNLVNTGAGSVSIATAGLDSGYLIDSVYTITVTVDDGTKTIFGFELTALDSAHNPAGSFQNTTTKTTLQNGNIAGKTRRYISHKNAGSTNTFSFTWKAPSTNLGKVIFYACGNAANGNGGTSGDLIYTNTKEVIANPKQIEDTTSVQNQLAKFVQLRQTATQVVIENQEGLALNIQIYNAVGTQVAAFQSRNSTEIFEKSAFSTQAGVYFMMIGNGKSAICEKIIVL
jgi:hypothetical protein